MESDLFYWVVARVSGLSAFMVLAVSVATGLALRSGVLDVLGSNRSIRSLHQFTAFLWIPLGLLHLAALLLDRTARIDPRDIVVPFQVQYGTLAIGLGTVTFELFAVVAITGWLRGWLTPALWLWIHRLSYVAFGLLFFHALLGGSDFTDHRISAVTWAAALAVALLTLARVVWRRLPP
jgi:methionine sulfoxide reductase heme-binding subunit